MLLETEWAVATGSTALWPLPGQHRLMAGRATSRGCGLRGRVRESRPDGHISAQPSRL